MRVPILAEKETVHILWNVCKTPVWQTFLDYFKNLDTICLTQVQLGKVDDFLLLYLALCELNSGV